MPQSFPRDTYDALIVGARCAGAATAMLLARQGLRVLAIDWAEEGSDTMSTHALMRGAVMQLDRWDVLPDILSAGTPPVRKTTFFYGSEEIALPIKPTHGVDALIAPRRTVLDAALVSAARKSGADVRFKTALRALTSNAAGRVTGAIIEGPDGQSRQICAKIVIGADGRRSLVARKVGAKKLAATDHKTSCIYSYFNGMQDDGYRWYYDTDVAAGAIPTNDGAHCVFVSVPDSQFSEIRGAADPADLLKSIAGRANAALGEELAVATCLERPVVFSGADGHMLQSAGPGWALVGDAGYFKDPLTAHGITDALRDAEILARAVTEGTDTALNRYQTQRDRLSTGLFGITDRIASFDWTIADLQMMHRELNAEMKAEQAWMAAEFASLADAA